MNVLNGAELINSYAIYGRDPTLTRKRTEKIDNKKVLKRYESVADVFFLYTP